MKKILICTGYRWFRKPKIETIICIGSDQEIDTESELISCVQNLELKESVWSCNRTAKMTVDLHQHRTNGESSFVELLFKDSSCLNIQNSNDKLCGLWCKLARLLSVKVFACGGKSFNFFDAIKTIRKKLENE